jgi:hypothetical protein
MRFRVLLVVGVCVVLAGVTGCPPADQPAPPGPATGQPAAAPEEDRQPPADSGVTKAAVERVEALSGIVERGPNGAVVSIDLESMQAAATDEDLELFSRLPHLTTLKVTGPEISDAGIAHLAKLEGLEVLWLVNTTITNEGLVPLKELPKLKELNLRRSEGVTDEGLAHLRDFPSLQYLHLLYNSFSDDGLKHLEGMTQLRLLDLRGNMGLTDEGIAHLAGLTGLRALKLRSLMVGNAGLEHLKGLTELTHLTVEDAQMVSDPGLEHVAELKNLEELNLMRATSVTDEGAAKLAGLPLKSLYLRGTTVTGTGLAALKDAPLVKLDLGEAAVNDEGLEKGISQLKGLEWLDLWNTFVTDAGLEHLAGLDHLKYLRIEGTNATDAGAATLQESLPNAEIVR